MADIRKRNGEDGAIRYQVRFIDRSTKSGFRYKTFKNAKQAKLYKSKKDIEEEIETPNPPSQMSVDEAIQLWLNICEKIGRDGREPVEMMTLKEYYRRSKVMLQYNWEKQLHKLRPADVVQFRNWLLQNYSRDIARRTLSSFGSALAEMSLQGHTDSNPAAGITVRSGGRYEMEDSEVQIPSDQEVRDILAATNVLKNRNDFMEAAWIRYQPMVYLMIFSGMRISEVRGLAWSNIHPQYVSVRQRADQLGTIGPVKSRSARRRIELSTQVTDLIFAWKERCPASEHDLVFPTSTGRPIMRTNFALDAWEPLFKEVDLMEVKTIRSGPKLYPKYTPHTMRHYFASKLIEKGKDLKYIQSRMGHSSAEITLNVYGHLMKDREEEHIATAEELVSELL